MLQFRPKSWQLAGLLVLLCAAVGGGLYLYRQRTVAGPSGMVALLPNATASFVYIDVGTVRSAGILGLLAGSKTAEEQEYRQFIDATGFDYQRDLQGIAAAIQDDQVFLALRGRFDWKRLSAYAQSQNGSCHNSYCVMPGSRPDRRISFYLVARDVMALAVSRDDFAAYQITRKSAKPEFTIPDQPLWAVVPAAFLSNPGELPAGLKTFASALRHAEKAVFTVGAEGDHLRLSVDVTCRDAASATTLLTQLEGATSTLRTWIAREHQTPNPADFSGILVAGVFERQDRNVRGRWPISKAFVSAVAGGGF